MTHDDIFINFNEIYSFLQEVTFFGDPKKNVIFLGRYIHPINVTHSFVSQVGLRVTMLYKGANFNSLY